MSRGSRLCRMGQLSAMRAQPSVQPSGVYRGAQVRAPHPRFLARSQGASQPSGGGQQRSPEDDEDVDMDLSQESMFDHSQESMFDHSQDSMFDQSQDIEMDVGEMAGEDTFDMGEEDDEDAELSDDRGRGLMDIDEGSGARASRRRGRSLERGQHSGSRRRRSGSRGHHGRRRRRRTDSNSSPTTSQSATDVRSPTDGDLQMMDAGAPVVRAAIMMEVDGEIVTASPRQFLPPLHVEAPRWRQEEPFERLANLLSENLQDMHEAQYNHLVFNPGAKYLRYRRVLVDCMCEIGEQLHLSNLTVHVAVRYMDKILGTTDVNKEALELVALASILVAAKYVERESHVPTIERLSRMMRTHPQNIRQMEVMVLQELSWHLGIATFADFVEAYCEQIVWPATDRESDTGQAVTETSVAYSRKYATFFCELCLQEYAFQDYPPALLAAAIVACCRRAVNLSPMWDERLEGMTKYSGPQVFECYSHIYSHYRNMFPRSSAAMNSPTSVLIFERQCKEALRKAAELAPFALSG